MGLKDMFLTTVMRLKAKNRKNEMSGTQVRYPLIRTIRFCGMSKI